MATRSNKKPNETPVSVEEPAEIQEAEKALTLDALIDAAIEQDGVLTEQREVLAQATQAKQVAEVSATAAWDAIYDRLMALREEYKTSPGFDQSKLKRLLNRADR